MRRTPLLLAALTAVGCTTAQPEPQPEPQPAADQDAERLGERAERAVEREAEGTQGAEQAAEPPRPVGTGRDPLARPEHDPEAAHRARKFYLQGIKLLHDPQRVDEAIRDFNLALRHDPLFFKAHFKLGICYYHKGQYDLEIAEYKKCLSLAPLYVPAQLNLGHAYLARDMLEQARDAYQKVIAQEPHNAVALYNLGLVEYDLRSFERSYDYLARFLETSQDEGQMGQRARMYLEEIRHKRRQREEAN